MPNYVKNILTGTFPSVEKANAYRALCKGETSLDFQRIIPRPKTLDILSPSDCAMAYAHMRLHEPLPDTVGQVNWMYYLGCAENELEKLPSGWIEGTADDTESSQNLILSGGYPRTKEEFLFLGRTACQNMTKYGHASWYEWNIANWGTKWNAMDVSENIEGTTVEFVFDTAWSAPFPVVQALAKKFPDAVFTLQYADEELQSGNAGSIVYEHGQEIEDNIGDAFEFACEIWGLDPAEELRECDC